MGKAGNPQITKNTLVPYTNGIKYGQLCHVRRNHALCLEPGALLAYDGAWDRKAVVSYVVHSGIEPNWDGNLCNVYNIGLVRLGNFYARGDFRADPQPIREVVVLTNSDRIPIHRWRCWVLVEPFKPGPKVVVTQHRTHSIKLGPSVLVGAPLPVNV